MIGVADGDAAGDHEAAHESAAQVAVEIRPLHGRQCAAAIDEAARDRAALALVVFAHREREAGGRCRATREERRGLEAEAAFEDVPAEIGAAAARRQKVDLLALCVADVADVQVAADAVEAEAPRIAPPFAQTSPAIGPAAGLGLSSGTW